MDTAFIQQVALPIVYVVVGIVLVWALVELILFLRNTRKTVSTLEEEIRPVISDVKEMTESLKPAVDKMDPLAERVSLAVDAANLEIMRLDGILENVDAMTTSAAGAANAVETVANTPMKLVNTAAEKLRGAVSQKKASDASVALGSAAEEAQAAALGAASEGAAQPAAPVEPVEAPAPAAVETVEQPAVEPALQVQDVPAAEPSAPKAEEASSGYFTYNK